MKWKLNKGMENKDENENVIKNKIKTFSLTSAIV